MFDDPRSDDIRVSTTGVIEIHAPARLIRAVSSWRDWTCARTIALV